MVFTCYTLNSIHIGIENIFNIIFIICHTTFMGLNKNVQLKQLLNYRILYI